MAHPNEELTRRGYEAFAKGDVATLNEVIAEDIVWHVPGRNQLSGDYRGKEEVLGLFAKFAELTGGTFRLDIHDVLANDAHSIVLVKNTGQRESKALSDNGVGVYHIRNSQVTEAWFHPGDTYATDDFWS